MFSIEFGPPRWFVLDTEAGTLAYHLMDERHLKSRGTQHLSGSVVIPSDEDSVTFSVSFASGDVFKVSKCICIRSLPWSM